jgi:hypothetical protein
MVTLQVVPRPGVDAYRLLRAKVTKEARTWWWRNRTKTRLSHKQRAKGYIQVAGGEGVLLAHFHPGDPADLFFFVEKFIGRLVAWFEADLVAINVQLGDGERRDRRRRRAPRRRA